MNRSERLDPDVRALLAMMNAQGAPPLATSSARRPPRGALRCRSNHGATFDWRS